LICKFADVSIFLNKKFERFKLSTAYLIEKISQNLIRHYGHDKDYHATITTLPSKNMSPKIWSGIPSRNT